MLNIPLADRLDSGQLLAAYQTLTREKVEIDRKNELLNRNLLKHFRLKKVYRAYNPDNQDQVPELFKKYREALDRLDEVKNYTFHKVFQFESCYTFLILDNCQPQQVVRRL